MYRVLALGMRYWFALLGMLIVLRSFHWLHKDRRATHRRRTKLETAGCVGQFLVLSGNEELPPDTALPVLWEGVLGSIRTCDVVLPCGGVSKTHLDFSFHEREGLYLYPLRGRVCAVNGQELTKKNAAYQQPMQHNDVLVVGDAMLRLQLFEALDIPRSARISDRLPDSAPQQAYPPAYPQYGMPVNGQQQMPQPQDPSFLQQQSYAPPPAQGLPRGYGMDFGVPPTSDDRVPPQDRAAVPSDTLRRAGRMQHRGRREDG